MPLSTVVRPQLVSLGLLLGLVSASVGCSSAVDTLAAPPQVASVRLSQSELTLVLGRSGQIVAQPLGVDGAPIAGHPVTWSSSDNTVATVTPDGVITGLVANKSAIIMATVDSQHASLLVRVELPVPSHVSLVSGGGQSAWAGNTLQLVFQARDQMGNPYPGALLQYSFTGDGSVLRDAFGSTPVSGSDGLVLVNWRLGSVPGAYAITANLYGRESARAEGTATPGIPGTPALVAVQQGTRATMIVGEIAWVVFKVTDADGKPVYGAAPDVAVSGGGSIMEKPAFTGSDGLYSVSWKMGNTAGPNTLAASLSGASRVTVGATTTAGPAAQVQFIAGDGQTAVVGNPVTTPPSVRVTDALGNPVAGTRVLFYVSGGGGTVSAPNAMTDAGGIATAGAWTLGPSAGVNTLNAAYFGNSIRPAGSVSITATATAP